MRRSTKHQKFSTVTVQSITHQGCLNAYNSRYLFAVTVYVVFRNTEPDEDTMAQVLVQLQENNIDIAQLLEVTTVHCQ